MKYKFVKFKDENINCVFWFLEISSKKELFYWYNNYLKKNFPLFIKDLNSNKHPTTTMRYLLEEKTSLDYLTGKNDPKSTSKTVSYEGLESVRVKYSIGEIKDYFMNVIFKPKLEVLNKYKKIYINGNGGFIFNPDKFFTRIDEKVSDKLKFPSPTIITITKWAGGTHYYINDRKFNSLQQAIDFAKELEISNYELKEVYWNKRDE